MARPYILVTVLGLILGACATRVVVSSPQPVEPAAFPVSFSAAGLAGTEERFFKAVDPTYEIAVAYVAILKSDQTHNRAYIQTYHYSKGTYGTKPPDFKKYLPEFEPAFQNKRLRFEPVQVLLGHDGNISYQAFSVDDASCVAFFEYIRINDSTPANVPGDGEVNGYYCAPTGERLDDAEVRDFLLSLHHRDARRPSG